MQSGDFIGKSMKANPGTNFLDITGPNDIATKKRERLLDTDDDDDNSSTDSSTKEIVPTAEIRGSPAGNTKRGGRGAQLLRVPVEGSSGSPATNTRGRKKRK